MEIDPKNVICLIPVIVGAVLMFVSVVLRHKGMWDLRNDDASFHNPRGIDSPYELTTVGVIFFAIGIIGEIWITFGLKAGLWSTVAAAVINATANVIWLRHIEEDDKDPRTTAAVNILGSVFAIFIAGLMLFLT